MRATLILALATAATLAVPGCQLVMGYDANDPVKLTIVTTHPMNVYGEENESHNVWIYFFKVRDRTSFEAADPEELVDGERVAGVEAAAPEKESVDPDQTVVLDIQPMYHDQWKYLGVIARFRAGSVKAVAKIPWSATLRLKLGPQNIESFDD